jgi:hypothetical protein
MADDEAIALPFHRRWWFALSAGSVGQFLAWCIADVFYVLFDLRDSDPLFLAMPPLVFLANVWLLRPQPNWLLLSLCLALLSTAAAFMLVLHFGIPFHFAIGGRI